MINLRDVEYVDQFELPRLVMSNQYRCVDGRWVQNHGMYRRFMQRFMTMLGREDWLDEAMALWGKPLQPEVGKKWLARFEDLFLQRTAKEWEDAISAAGGACGMCRTIDEWMVHEHAIAGRMVEEVDDAHLGRMKQPGVVVRLRGTPGRVQGRAPLLGEHTEAGNGSLDRTSSSVQEHQQQTQRRSDVRLGRNAGAGPLYRSRRSYMWKGVGRVRRGRHQDR